MSGARLRRRLWFFVAPLCGLAAYLAFATLVVRYSNGDWPKAVLEALPSLARHESGTGLTQPDHLGLLTLRRNAMSEWVTGRLGD